MDHDFEIFRFAIEFVIKRRPEFQHHARFGVTPSNIIQLRGEFVLPLVREHLALDERKNFHRFVPCTGDDVLLG